MFGFDAAVEGEAEAVVLVEGGVALGEAVTKEGDHATFESLIRQRVVLTRVGPEIEEKGTHGVGIDPGTGGDLEGAAALGKGERFSQMEVLELGCFEAMAHMGGHEGVFEKRGVVGAGRGAHVDVTTIGEVDMAAMDAKDACLADGGVVGNGSGQGATLHGVGRLDPEEVKDGGGQVDGLDQGGPAFASAGVAGIPNEEGGIG